MRPLSRTHEHLALVSLHRSYAGLVGACHVLVQLSGLPSPLSHPLSRCYVITCKGLFNPWWAAGPLKCSIFVACIARRDLASRLIPAFLVYL